MGDPEFNLEVSAQEDGSALVTGDVRIHTQCGECFTDLSETNQDVEIEIEVQHQEECSQHEEGTDVVYPEFSLEEEVESEDRYEGKGRGVKHFYGARLSVKVTCERCGAEGSGEQLVEEQASSMDSLS